MEFVGKNAKKTISKQVLQENKARQISQKTNISCGRGKKCSFFGKFGVLCFLVKHLLLRFTFLPCYRQIISGIMVSD